MQQRGEPPGEALRFPDAAQALGRIIFQPTAILGLIELRKRSGQDQDIGGGKVQANLNIIAGADRIRRFFVGLAEKFGQTAPPWSRPLRINGLPGYVSIDPAGIVQTTALEIEDGRITAVYIVRNPDKLVGAAAFVSDTTIPPSSTDQ